MEKRLFIILLMISTLTIIGLNACAQAQELPESSSSATIESEQKLSSTQSEPTKVSATPKKDHDDKSIYIINKITHYNKNAEPDWIESRSLDTKGNITRITRNKIVLTNTDEGVEIKDSNTITYSDFNTYGYPKSAKTESKSFTYSYREEDGRLIQEEMTNEKPSSTTTYEFYPTGIIKSKVEEEKTKEETITTTTTYDEQGYVQTHTEDGENAYSDTYAWVFDAAGNPIEYTKDIENTSDDEFYWVENDGLGNIASINRPDNGQAIYEFEYKKIRKPSKAAIAENSVKDI